MELDAFENQNLQIVPEPFFGVEEGTWDFIKELQAALVNTVNNWDVVLFLCGSFVLIVGSILMFLCSIHKIFRFQSDREHNARERIRLVKMAKHREYIQTQKSLKLEREETVDDEIFEKKSEPAETYDTPITDVPTQITVEPKHTDDDVYNQWPEPPQLIDVDYSTIDVPDTYDMWPEPPEILPPLNNLDDTHNVNG